jgi:hypothetical protein
MTRPISQPTGSLLSLLDPLWTLVDGTPESDTGDAATSVPGDGDEDE